ncbi:MAG: hypothetical protein RL757_2910 [Bacteroidota bacterium]|jgi:tetratricopeptide (TPR) repeat protein
MMIKKCTQFVFSLVFYFNVSHGVIAQPLSLLDSLVKQASEANAQQNYLTAIRNYDQIIAQLGENETAAKFYFYRGQNRTFLDQNDRARTDYDRALALQPRYFDAFLARAVLFMNTDEPENAINDFNMAIRYSDSSATILSFLLNNRGLAKRNRADFEGAIRDFRQAAIYVSTNQSTRENLAAVLLETNQTAAAIEIYEKLLAETPNSANLQMLLGMAHAQNKEFDKAISAYTQALELQPNQPAALNNRGLAHFNMHNYSAALTDINHSIDLYPNDPYAFRNRGMIRVALRQRSAGCEDFQKAIELGFSKRYDLEVAQFIKKYCL